MQNGLESRLRDLFAQLPSASRAVEDRALAAALGAIPAAEARRRRPLRTLALAGAGAIVLLAVSAGALAAAGALHVSLSGPSAQPRQTAVSRLILPQGAHGIAAVVDGRLWLTSRGGLRIEGLPVDSAALSPHALYVAAGIGDSLVVMAPNGTRAWSHATGGRVVAIAWAPSGLRIAYVVRRSGGGVQLRTIEGDGDHDRLLDAAVRPVAPSWRADALAVAYVGAGGRPVVYDFGQRAHHVVDGNRAKRATSLAFAPQGRALAIAAAGHLWISGDGNAAGGSDVGPGSVAGMAWAGADVALALNPPPARTAERAAVQIFRVGANGATLPGKRLVVAGWITALDAGAGRLVVAVRRQRSQTRLVSSVARNQPATVPRQVLLQVPAGSTVSDLAFR